MLIWACNDDDDDDDNDDDDGDFDSLGQSKTEMKKNITSEECLITERWLFCYSASWTARTFQTPVDTPCDTHW